MRRDHHTRYTLEKQGKHRLYPHHFCKGTEF
jgi:hypothetical protein